MILSIVGLGKKTTMLTQRILTVLLSKLVLRSGIKRKTLDIVHGSMIMMEMIHGVYMLTIIQGLVVVTILIQTGLIHVFLKTLHLVKLDIKHG